MYSGTKGRQQGITLLELMISLAIGLLLLLALASLMVTANNSAKQRSTSELLDEQARQVFYRLENDLYKAGFVDPFMSEATLIQAFNTNNREIAAGYTRQQSNIANVNQASLLGRVSQGTTLPLMGFDHTTAAGALPAGMTCTAERQCLQIAYQAIAGDAVVGNFSSVATEVQEQNSLSGAFVGCNGVQANATFPILVNRYQLSVVAGENHTNLSCIGERRDFAGNSGGDGQGLQPAVVGVDQLVFRYLITPHDTTESAATPNLGTTASGRSVTAYQNVAGVLATPLQWAGVLGVEACVVVAAEPLDGGREADIPGVQPIIPSCLREDNEITANAPWAADRPRPEGDMRLYRRYVRTILMPNSVHLVN